MSALRHAFKEWAVICRALAEGRQAIILRKGGIAEAQGEFRPEHSRFWLFPTYVHQQRDGLSAEAMPLLEHVEAERPPAGKVRLSHFVEIPGVYYVSDLALALRLASLHCWSQDTVASRFAYRAPGLYVLPARVYRAAQAHEIEDAPEFAGCRTWVELKEALPTDGEPVLDDEAFREVLRTLDRLLEPTAWV